MAARNNHYHIMSAADKVFRILSLAEDILMNLPMLEIVRLQTITLKCYSAVKVFSPLRRALFLEPFKDCQARLDNVERYFKIADCASIEGCDEREVNDPMEYLHQAQWVCEPSAQECNIVLNPVFAFFNERKPDGSELNSEDESDHPLPCDIEPPQALGHPSSKLEVKGELVGIGHLSSQLENKGFLMSMLLTQPPLATLVIQNWGANHSHVLRPEEGTEGVTILQVQRHLEAFPNAVGGQYIWRLDGFTILPVTSTGAEITAEVKAAMGLK